MKRAHAAGALAGALLFGVGINAFALADRSGGFVGVPGYGQVPLAFEANEGQVDRAVRFLARGPGYQFFLTPTEAVFDLGAPSHPRRIDARRPDARRADSAAAAPRAVLRMSLAGANRNAGISGIDELGARSHYFVGSDPAKWRGDVKSFAKVRYAGVYPGIDVVYYGSERRLEYDFIVAPGADPKRIALDFKGSRKLAIDADGNLVVALAGGKLVQHKPIVYQQIGSERRMIDGRYVLRGKSRAAFHVAAYDATKPLVIDPVLEYASYLGGAGEDRSYSRMARDGQGNVYIVIDSEGPSFPVSPGALQPAQAGGGDAVVVKLDASGNRIYATYLGGTLEDYPTGVAADAQGNAYIVGGTKSADFPVTTGALQTVNRSSPDHDSAFVTKLDPTGAIVYSTFVGGTDGSPASGIVVDANGFAYVAGYTLGDHPTTPGAFQTTYGGSGDDAFVFKLNPTGTAFVYSTYLGGPGFDAAGGIVIDDDGFAYVTGGAGEGFPTTAGAYQTTWAGGQRDGFATKLNQDGSGLVWSTYLGGPEKANHFADDIVRDRDGNVYIAGDTHGHFLTTPGSYQPSFRGGPQDTSGPQDVFVIKLDPSGSIALYATYLGGSENDFPATLQVDERGSLYITGGTSSTDFPVTPSALLSSYAGGSQDGFLAVLSPSGSALLYSTYLGTAGRDFTWGLLRDPSGNVYFSGMLGAATLPTTPNALQPSFGGGDTDAFIVKFAPDSSLRNFQGLWWRFPAGIESGWGINLTHQSDIIFATWFTYDANGKPTWFAAVLNKTGPDLYAGDVFATTGPPYNAVPWDPSTVVETTVGTMSIAFGDLDNATFSFTIDGHSKTQPITRQLFATPVPGCAWNALADLAFAKNHQALWWKFPATSESGWGANFTHQGDIIFVTWFTYDENGKPWWLIAVAAKKPNGRYEGPISTVVGSPYYADPWDATAVVETEVGTLTITFTDGNRASYAYTIGPVSQTKEITQQVFGPPGTLCE